MAKRVLVVDDYPPTVELLREALETAGFAVTSARNGAECLYKVEAERPDLVILDVMMPVMDGLEALRVLRGNPETRYLPVILLTGRREWADFLDGNRQGASLYLTKPIELQRVISSAEWLLGVLHESETAAPSSDGLESPCPLALTRSKTVEL